jgi:Uri superfamily endonuclease
MMRGVYVLIITVSRSIRVKVGALGSVNFERGFYAYVGSAQNNLEKRVSRHLRRAKRKFWHIDYLLENEAAKVLKVFYIEAGKPSECETARRIGDVSVPVESFGASDCRCKSHLFKLDNHQFLTVSMREMVLAK